MPDNTQPSPTLEASDAQMQESLAHILTSLAGGPDSVPDALAEFHKQRDTGRIDLALATRNPEHFRLHASYPLERVIQTLLKQGLGDNTSAVFLFGQYRFVEGHFKELYTQLEGSACCADKSRWATRALARHFLDGKPIVADFSQEYTFHLPKRVLNTQESILAFFDALRSLYAGRPQKYLTVLDSLYKTAAAAGADDAAG